MKQYSYKELSKISGERINTLAVRVKRINLKGVLGDNSEVFFNKNESFRILNYTNRIAVKNHPRKIEAVEMYIARLGIRNIAHKLLIAESAVEMYSKEYRENDGFIIVESSINLNIINL